MTRILSALALSAAAVEARRSLSHVGPVGERLEAVRSSREPQVRNEYLPATKRASSASYQFLTNKTQGESVVDLCFPSADDLTDSLMASLPRGWHRYS